MKYNARRALRSLEHTDTIRDYVNQLSALVLEIRNMSEKDKLFCFLEGLQPWARVELHHLRVLELLSAQNAVGCLVDYVVELED